MPYKFSKAKFVAWYEDRYLHEMTPQTKRWVDAIDGQPAIGPMNDLIVVGVDGIACLVSSTWCNEVPDDV